MAMPRRSGGSRRMSRPLTVMVPERAAVNPDKVRNNVVLPHPEAPSNATKMPGAMDRSMPLSTSWLPYATCRSRTEMMGAMLVIGAVFGCIPAWVCAGVWRSSRESPSLSWGRAPMVADREYFVHRDKYVEYFF